MSFPTSDFVRQPWPLLSQLAPPNLMWPVQDGGVPVRPLSGAECSIPQNVPGYLVLYRGRKLSVSKSSAQVIKLPAILPIPNRINVFKFLSTPTVFPRYSSPAAEDTDSEQRRPSFRRRFPRQIRPRQEAGTGYIDRLRAAPLRVHLFKLQRIPIRPNTPPGILPQKTRLHCSCPLFGHCPGPVR